VLGDAEFDAGIVVGAVACFVVPGAGHAGLTTTGLLGNIAAGPQ
jgi:hypothetical protein